MNSYINLNNKFRLDRENKELINIETGEIYTKQEEIIEILEQLKKDKHFNRDMEKAVRNIWNLKTELELYQQKWKNDSWFIKIYRTERRKFLEYAKLSTNASALLFHLEGYLEFKTNRIATKNGKRFTNKDLQAMTGLSSVTLKHSLNELEDKLIIKRVGKSQSREIYINPYLMCAGNKMSKEIENLFKEYVPFTPY